MMHPALAMLAASSLMSVSAYAQASNPANTIQIYECTKPGDNTTCKTSVRPLAQDAHRGGPHGSSALCNDGVYSKAPNLDPNTCAGHQGVKIWYGH